MNNQALIISESRDKPTVDQMVAGWLHAKASLSHSQMTLDAYTDYMQAFRALLHQYGLDLDSEETVMNPQAFAEGLVPSRSPAGMIIPCPSLAETIGCMTDAWLEAGLTFLHDKAISCRNAYVTVQVQAVAPRFQGVPKHRTSIPQAALFWLPCLHKTKGGVEVIIDTS